jgi:D-alanine transaminase
MTQTLFNNTYINRYTLLPNVLAKQTAKKKGAYEAWLVSEDGFVTEGTSTNAWIVTKKGVLVTRPPDTAILNGVTRRSVLRLAEREGIGIEERGFALREALSAREAFITSTTNYVMPVVHIDGKPVGDGKPGPFSRRLRETYLDYMSRSGTPPDRPARTNAREG